MIVGEERSEVLSAWVASFEVHEASSTDGVFFRLTPAVLDLLSNGVTEHRHELRVSFLPTLRDVVVHLDERREFAHEASYKRSVLADHAGPTWKIQDWGSQGVCPFWRDFRPPIPYG